MDLIIKSLSPETFNLAMAVRNFLEGVTDETVILVPQGLKTIYIVLENQDTLCSVSLWGETNELDLIQGFLHYEYAEMYAEAVGKEAGLSNNILVKNREGYEQMKHKK